MRTPRHLSAITSLLLAAGVVLPGHQAAAAPAAEPSAAPPSQPSQVGQARTETVTLVTGDQVTYTRGPDGQESATTRPAARGSGPPPYFATRSDQTGFYVIPSDVRPYLEAGTLDRQLFDVRDLVAAGLADRSGRDLPVIARYRARAGAASLGRAADALPASTRTVTLPTLNSAALSVRRGQAGEFWRAVSGQLGTAVGSLWFDAPVRADLADSVPQIGAPQAWRAGFDGTGVTVAVLDTGVDATHPDLAGRVAGARNFTPEATAGDGYGHGTHVASIIAGTGAASGGSRKGVAPGAMLLSGKVLDNRGSGATSWILEGMDWAAHSGADVINMSLGGFPTDGTDALSQAVNTLSAETGVLFVTSAGNFGVDAGVSSPGAADSALTVAAVDKQDKMAFFSSRGPRVGDGGLKPEIAAPGVNIVAARAAGTHLGRSEGQYTSLSGTSMAAPHVAGSAALLAQAHPDWTGQDLKSTLVGSATPLEAGTFEQGAGRVDVPRALAQPVSASPATVSFGAFSWPQADLPAVPRTVTYTNRGTAPLTLHLSAAAKDLLGAAAPDGVLTVSPDSVTVPAGGTAQVSVTLHPGAGSTGAFAGNLLATSTDGAVSVRTPLAYYKQSPTRRLTVRSRDSQGGTRLQAFIDAVRADGLGRTADPFLQLIYSVSANGTTELPAGVYDIGGALIERDLTRHRQTVFVESEVDLTGADAHLEFDARTAVSLRPRTEDRTDAHMAHADMVYKLGNRFAFITNWDWEYVPDAELYGIPARRAPSSPNRFTFNTDWALAPPRVTARAAQDPGTTLYPVNFSFPSMAEQLDGTFTLPLVDVGDGAEPADYAGRAVAGAFALARLAPPPGTNPFEYLIPWSNRAIPAAKAAGATALLVYLDLPDAKVYQPLPANDVRLPVLSLSLAEGQRLSALLARGRVDLTVSSSPRIDYSYLLHFGYPRGVPAAGPGLVRRRDLATVPIRLHGDDPAMSFGIGYPAYGTLPGGGVQELRTTGPGEFTAYVGPVSDQVVWAPGVNAYDSTGRYLETMRSQERYVTRGRYPVQTWFAGPLVPGAYDLPAQLRGKAFEQLCGFCREGDWFIPFGYNLDANPSHGIFTAQFQHQLQLFTGNEELPPRSLGGDLEVDTYYQLPPEPATYRLLDTFTDPRGGGRVVRSDWTFHSAGRSAEGSVPAGGFCLVARTSPDASCRHEPLINVRYGVGNVGADNTLRGGRLQLFEVTAGHHPQSGGAPITAVRVEVSGDDGAHWRAAFALPTGDGRYLVATFLPGSGALSLRVSARDATGNSVTQEVIRAYRLR